MFSVMVQLGYVVAFIVAILFQ